MARAFVSASTQYLSYDGAILDGVPITMACFFNVPDITDPHPLISIVYDGGADDFFVLNAHGGESDHVLATTKRSAASWAETTTAYSANTWHHGCAVFAAADDRRAYIDGGSKGTESTSRIPANLNVTSVGANLDTTPVYSDGSIAEAAIWNVALSDNEIAQLAAGKCPLLVRFDNLVAYWPLISDDLDDTNNGYNLTPYNSPTWTSHPLGMTYPDYVGVGPLSLSLPLTQKPGVGARVDLGHELAEWTRGCWLHNDGGGSIVHDAYSGPSGHGDFQGSNVAWYHQGLMAPGVDFNQTAGAMSGGSSVVIREVGPMLQGTLSAWVVCDAIPSSDYATIFAHTDYGASHRLYMRVDSSGNVSVRLGSSSEATRGTIIAGELIHLVLTWAGGDAYLYKNGIQQGAVYSYSGTPGSDPGAGYNSAWGAFDESGSSWTHAFDGKIYDMRILHRGVSQSQVTELYAAPYAMFSHPFSITPGDVWASLVPEVEMIPFTSPAWRDMFWHQMKPGPGARVDLANTLNDKLVAWYLMNEGGGTIVHDLSLSRNDGSQVNYSAAAWVSGPRGLVFEGDGGASDRYIDIAPAPIIDVPFSASGWFRMTSPDANSTFFSIADGAATDDYIHIECGAAANTITLRRNGGVAYPNISANMANYVDNEWYHFVLTVTANGSNVDYRFYLDGALIYSGDNHNSNPAGTWTRMFIGARADLTPSNYFVGQLDDFRVWQRVLQASEVRELYEAPFAAMMPPFPPQLAAPVPPYEAGILPFQLLQFPSTMKPGVGARVDSAYGLSRGLTGAWPFNEGGGVYVHDAGPDKNHGATQGSAPVWEQGIVGPCLAYNGTDQYTQMASTPAFQSIESAGSIAIRIRPNWSSGDNAIHAILGSDISTAYHLRMEHYLDNTYYMGWVTNSTDYRATSSHTAAPMTNGEWYWWVLTWDESVAETIVYQDGVEVFSNTSSLVTHTPTAVLRVGAYLHGGYTYGDIDFSDVLMWNRCLTPGEVAGLCRIPYAMFASPPIVLRVPIPAEVPFEAKATGAALVPYNLTGIVPTMKPGVGATVNRANKLARGLIRAYLMNEGGGSAVHDVSVFRRDGTHNAASPPTADSGWGQGSDGPAMKLDGTDDVITSSSFTVSSAGMTFLMAIRPDGDLGATSDGLFDTNPSAIGAMRIMGGITNALQFDIGGDSGTTKYTIGDWTGERHTLALVVSDDSATCEVSLYIDGLGVYLDRAQDKAPVCSTFLIGSTNSNEFDGFFEWMYVYDRALDSDEIGEILTSPYAMFQHPLLAVRTAAEVVTDIVISGSTAWGHVTGVLETNVRVFSGNWTGTGTISGSGDSEIITLEAGQYMENEVVEISGDVEILQNNYGSGDTVTLKYRHGATEAACEAASWTAYSSGFSSLGYVQIRIESTL